MGLLDEIAPARSRRAGFASSGRPGGVTCSTRSVRRWQRLRRLDRHRLAVTLQRPLAPLDHEKLRLAVGAHVTLAELVTQRCFPSSRDRSSAHRSTEDARHQPSRPRHRCRTCRIGTVDRPWARPSLLLVARRRALLPLIIVYAITDPTAPGRPGDAPKAQKEGWATAFSRSTNFMTFPDGVTGRLSTTSIRRGTLKLASRSRHHATISPESGW